MTPARMLILQILLPPFPVSDQVNQGWRNISHYRKGVWVNATQKKFSDVLHALGCKFMGWLKLAVKVNQASFPGMLCIPLQTHPFKIFSTVVGLVSVYVVDAKPILVSRDKSSRDQPMQQDSRFHAVLPQTNLSVSGVMTLRCVALGFSNASNSLLNSIANSCVLMRSLWSFYGAHVAYQKLNAFFRDRFPYFHFCLSDKSSVHIIGGSW